MHSGPDRGLFPPVDTFVFVTSNENKWREAQLILGRALERVTLDLPELQLLSVADVAREKAKAAFEVLKRPLIVEDAGLELAAFGGFPGPFIKFWEKQGGLPSICRALDAQQTRAAQAVCALAVATAKGVEVVEGRAKGTIAQAPAGSNGFGWDSIFVPEGGALTWGQVTAREKDQNSHRRHAWEALRQRL